MAGRLGRIGTWVSGKPLIAATIVAIGLCAIGWVARAPVAATSSTPVKLQHPAEKPDPAPAAISAPAPKPVEEPFIVKRILKIDGPFTHGRYVWDDQGIPAGPVVVTIDLAAQTLSVFRGGYEIGAAVILYGADDKPTPLGSFAISEKDADHVSNLYDAPMPYMLRLTNDGVAIHGSDVEWGSATHGCIGIPVAFARLLFAQAKLGDRVIVTNGKMLDLGEQITGT